MIMKFKRSLLAFVCAIFVSKIALSMTAGEIRWTAVDLFTYDIEVHLYIREPFDRPSIELDLGDGTSLTVARSLLEQWEWGCHGIRYNVYQYTHTFSAPGTYILGFQESSRGGGIINIPNSIAQAFCVTATLVIDPLLGPNSSVHFLTPVTLAYQEGMAMIHDPGTFESDGDSLIFELVQPLGWECQPISGYSFSGGSGSIELDPGNGMLTCMEPAFQGELAFAIQCTEWRNGQIIGQVTRDMGICIPEDFFTGVPEYEEHPLFTLWPSVTKGFIQFDNPNSSSIAIEIYTVSGSVALRSNIPAGRHTVSLEGISKGIYIVSGTDTRGVVHNARIVVQ